ncbi:SAM-dependent methyltransferase [Sulfolobaceae archaeon RB850M]|jgi:hypothetical protein
MQIFIYGKSKILILEGYEFVYYATFIAREWDFLKLKKHDVVLDTRA